MAPTYNLVLNFFRKETIISNKIFGLYSTIRSNYVSENREYSFTFNLTILPYFNNSLSNIENVFFLVKISCINVNINHIWSIKLRKGVNIYSFKD